jgi:hypothetical protein
VQKGDGSLTIIIAGVIVAISMTAFLVMWFWVVHQALQARQNTVESAQKQLIACRKKLMHAREGPEESDAQCILTRSRDIYRQSVMLYNQTLIKPWNRIPGILMGFRLISKGNDG